MHSHVKMAAVRSIVGLAAPAWAAIAVAKVPLLEVSTTVVVCGWAFVMFSTLTVDIIAAIHHVEMEKKHSHRTLAHPHVAKPAVEKLYELSPVGHD